MTHKQRLFVKHYVDTKGNATEAAARAYDVKDRGIARRVGSENLTKPVIRSSLAGYTHLFESSLVKTVADWADEDDVQKRAEAMKNARWGYEQIHGKATQRTENVSASFVHHTTDKSKSYGLD